MSRFIIAPKVEATATIQLNESELRALEALAGYGADAFMKVFYEHLGTHYMKPHEAGMRSVISQIRDEVPGLLQRINKARAAFVGEAPK